eukprot:scaffold19696_cov128-Isochrysis_galbana.AAC.4
MVCRIESVIIKSRSAITSQSIRMTTYIAAETYNAKTPRQNARNVSRYSSASPSTARSIEPSGPRSASPGPSAAQLVAAKRAATFRSIAMVVVTRYAIRMPSDESGGKK